MGSDRSLILTVVEDTLGRRARALDFQRAVDLLLFANTICIPLRASEVVGVLVLLFDVIQRAFIAFVKILTMHTVYTYVRVRSRSLRPGRG